MCHGLQYPTQRRISHPKYHAVTTKTSLLINYFLQTWNAITCSFYSSNFQNCFSLTLILDFWAICTLKTESGSSEFADHIQIHRLRYSPDMYRSPFDWWPSTFTSAQIMLFEPQTAKQAAGCRNKWCGCLPLASSYALHPMDPTRCLYPNVIQNWLSWARLHAPKLRVVYYANHGAPW